MPSPSRGKRRASRTAAPTSATPSPGGGGRSTTASSGATATTSRVPERSGTRITGAPNDGNACRARPRRSKRFRPSAPDDSVGLVSPKTLTGVELDLDDAPARESELFLVDGNNLAYRAYFALPEELATTEGFPTNALLGFTNMLFKLLSDYKPKGVVVAGDTRPVHRHEIAE